MVLLRLMPAWRRRAWLLRCCLRVPLGRGRGGGGGGREGGRGSASCDGFEVCRSVAQCKGCSGGRVPFFLSCADPRRRTEGGKAGEWERRGDFEVRDLQVVFEEEERMSRRGVCVVALEL